MTRSDEFVLDGSVTVAWYFYDAAYLELAMRRGLPLATLDEKLKTAARAVGVLIYSVA
jgi:predicted nucleic acid-binding protein